MVDSFSNRIFRYIVIGDVNTGKTSFCQRFAHNTLPPTHETTIGIDFFSRIVQLSPKSQSAKIQMWDTSGNETFKSVTRSYYKGSYVVLVFYDITSRTSFDNVVTWLNDVDQYAEPTSIIMLIGNKCDLESQRTVSTWEAELFARERHLMFREVSTKTNHGVEEIIHDTLSTIRSNLENDTSGRLSSHRGIRLVRIEEEQHGLCDKCIL